MKTLFAPVLLVLMANLGTASANELLAAAVVETEGSWSGELIYRDFGTDKRVSIPHRRTIHVGPNGSYALHQNTFTDPGYKVFSAQMVRVTPEAFVIASTTPDGIETETLLVKTATRESSIFEIVATGSGADDGKPAELRLRIRSSPTQMSIERSVRAPGGTRYEFRNEVRLNREPSSVR
ncbi:MAG: hypothetical protein AAGA22_08925 [Pseudomonadota bacterium]